MKYCPERGCIKELNHEGKCEKKCPKCDAGNKPVDGIHTSLYKSTHSYSVCLKESR